MQTSLIIDQRWDTPIEARQTAPQEPGESYGYYGRDWYVAEVLGLREMAGEVIVNHNTALTYSVVFACVRYISQTIASLSWNVFERTGEDGRTKKPIEDNIAWTIGMQANPEMNAFEFRQVMLKDALTWGNGYAEIERNKSGVPWWFWRIDPARVCVERDDAGHLIYEVDNGVGYNKTIVQAANMYHVKGPGPDGIMGWSMIALARRAIELGMMEEKFGNSFFKKGPLPGGVLKIPGSIKKQERDDTRRSFDEAYAGTKNAGKVIILTGGMEFEQMSLPNSDAQWLEGRSFQAEEIARFYGVPQHKIGILTRSTNNNIEHQAIEAVQDCLLPWCRRLETEADVKLFGRVTMGKKFTRLDLETLLRGDSRTQTETVTSKVTSGLLTINEGRDYFDKNPIEGGDTPLIQGAMVPLDRILEEPQADPAAPGQPAMPKKMEPKEPMKDGDMPESLRRTFGALFADAYGHLLRVVSDKARRAANKGQLRAWADEYFSQASESEVVRTIRPAVEAFLLVTGKDADSDALALMLARDHNTSSREAAHAGHELANGRAAKQATAHLDLLWEAVKR